MPTDQTFSKEQLLEKLSEIVKKSEFLPSWLLEKAKTLYQEKLEKLLILANEAAKAEKQLTQDQKDKINDLLIKFSQKKIEIYKNGLKRFLKDEEQREENADMESAEKSLAQL